ncbi:MAG: hypothetical protein OHK0024_10010 [Thalassobaculales bacterium]
MFARMRKLILRAGLGALLAGLPVLLEPVDAVPLDAVLVVGGGSHAPALVPLALWRQAESGRRQDLAELRAAAAQEAAGTLAAAAEAVAEDYRQRVTAFVDWRYSFFTSYRLMFGGIGGMFGGQAFTATVEQAVAERFRDIVLRPAETEARLRRAATAAGRRLNEHRAAFLERDRQGLVRLAAAGRLWRGEEPRHIVGPVGSSLPEAVVIDPVVEVAPTAAPALAVDREGAVAVGRQGVRRLIGGMVGDGLAATAAGAGAEAALLTTFGVTGTLGFAAGILVEWQAQKGFEALDRPDFEARSLAAAEAAAEALRAAAADKAAALTVAVFGD